MPNQDPAGVKANGKPQPFEPTKVKEAVARARQLVLALAADATGDEYRRVLERVSDEAFEDVDTEQQFFDRLAYVLYGAALFGLGALTLATEFSGKSQNQMLALLDRAVEAWLSQATA